MLFSCFQKFTPHLASARCLARTFAFLFTLLIPPLVAQPQQLAFRHLTIDDGLSQNAVFAILQDRQGFMWFGTKDGLNRFDGHDFKIFYNSTFDTTTLSSNHITALMQDARGDLWVGTQNGGLNRMRHARGPFVQYRHDAADTTSLSADAVSCLAGDAAGNLWIGTPTGLNKLPAAERDRPQPRFVRYGLQGGGSRHIHALFVDRQGTLWIGTAAGLVRHDPGKPEAGFAHFAVTAKNPAAPAGPLDNAVTAILEDRSGALWLGTTSGLVRFDRHTGGLVAYPHRYAVHRYGWGRITQILEDRSGSFWLATPGELMRFFPSEKKYTYYRHDPLDPGSLSYNGILSLWQDRSQVLWVGTAGQGLNLYDPKAERFATLRRPQNPASRIAGFSVRAILEDDRGDVWISTDVLYQWRRASGRLISYETSSDRPDDFGNTGAWSMARDSHGRLWVASSQGLFRRDLAGGRVRQYAFDPADTSGLREKVVWGVYAGSGASGEVWVASEHFFSRLVDEASGRFRHYRYRDDAADTEPAFTAIHRAGDGSFYLGTRTGLVRFDPASGRFQTYRSDPANPRSLNNDIIKSICPDPREPEQVLWLGTGGGGLNRLDLASGQVRHFTEMDGLPNNVVYGVLPQGARSLWLSTNKGLSRFDLQTEKFKNYDVSDGLQSNEFNTGAFFKGGRGELFFGGIKGLNYFDPAQVADNPHVPPVVITALKVLNQPRPLPQGPDAALRLGYRENVVSFAFAALEYSAPEKNRYAYKLENFGDDWIESGTGRTATFINLPAGAYVFRVIGSNNDGRWNETGAALRVVVESPPWKRWWAFALYGAALLGLLYGVRRYELNRLQLKNRLRLEHVETEKLREVDQLKSRFFANISHEFRTPLALITGPLQQLLDTLPGGESRRLAGIMQRNARRLLHLINQLLDLSKLDAGKMELHLRQADFVVFLRGLLTAYEALAASRRIEVQFHAQIDSLVMLFDHAKMENIFQNLLANAFKFTKDGGVVSLSMAADADAETIVVTVADTGAGIPDSQLGRIFDRFYQVDDGGDERGGTGIGLALAKELVELQRGSITVQSRPGEGTIFTVTLPVERAQVQLTEAAGQTAPVAAGATEPAGAPENAVENGAIVLVIEDDADMRAFICTVLRDGYRVIDAEDGSAGFETAAEVIPDLIISDLMMPKLDGYALCRKLKNDTRTSHIPVILLTARAGVADKLTGLQVGADDYLIKPFRSDELLARVHNLIAVRRKLIATLGKKALFTPETLQVTPVDQAFLQRVRQVIEREMGDEAFGLETLCAEMAMSERQLRRKVKALLGHAPSQVIRGMRLQRARQLLEQGAGTVAEIAYQVGFSSPAYFTKSFREAFGVLPSEVG